MAVTVLCECSVIDGAVPGRIFDDGAVAISGERILAVGDRTTVMKEVGRDPVAVVTLDGQFVVPGLWDAHIHLGAVVPPHEERYAGESEGQHMIRCLRKAQDNLRCGITSLRSLGERFGADLTIRDAIEAGTIEGPRIFASGDVMWSRYAAGTDEFRRMTRRMIQAGVDQVKILASGGIPWRSDSITHGLCNREELAAVVEEAHRWGKPVVVHAMGDETVVMAAELGVDTIEHGFAVTEEGVSAMASCGTTFCPNLAVTEAWDPAWLAAGPFPSWFVRNADEARRNHHRMFREAVSAGVPFIAGVDDLPEPDGPVGIERSGKTIGLVRELELMVDNGATPAQALAAATNEVARVVRADGWLGSLERGKLADLVVVGSNPLERIGALAEVRQVWKSGQEITLRPGPGLV